MPEKTVAQICNQCEKEFRVIPSRLKHGRGKHCSPACQYAARRQAPKSSVECVCIGCGNVFALASSRIRNQKGAGKFCTRKCRDAHWKGQLNPLWQNGSGIYKRGPHWQSIRRKVLARDRVCTACGASARLHVHHLTPFRMFTDPSVANSSWNLTSLCPPCHRKEDAKFKWVSIPGGALQMNSGGYAWSLAKERGLV